MLVEDASQLEIAHAELHGRVGLEGHTLFQAVDVEAGYQKLKNKLEKIEQIVKDHDNDSMPEDYWYIDKIREALEKE